MRKNIFTILLFSFLINCGLSAQNGQVVEVQKSSEAKKVAWLSWEEAVEQNNAEPKKIFIDIYTDWCGWCKRMDATTFSDPTIVEYLNDNFYSVKFNAEQKESITFKEHTFKYVPNGRRGYHELAASLLDGKMSYPTSVFLNEKVQMMQRLPGYMDTPTFMMIITYLGGEHFNTTPWEDYQQAYKKENP